MAHSKTPNPLVAKRLSELISESGVCLDDFARAAGCTKPHLSNIKGGAKPLTESIAETICRSFDKGFTGKKSKKSPVKFVQIFGLQPAWLLGLSPFKTTADLERAINRHSESWRAESRIDDAFMRLYTALGFDVALGTDESGELVYFVRDNIGNEKPIQKERFSEIRYAILSQAEWQFSRIFTENNKPGAGKAKEV